MTKFISEKIKMKSSARLSAVQAVYMIEFGQLSVDEVIKDFINGNVGGFVIDDDNERQTDEMVELNEIDTNYFATLVRGVCAKKETIEKSLESFMKEGWSFERLDGTMRAILLCATYEIINTLDIDVKVIIKEYVDIAYAFFTKNEPKVINAILDQISKEVRLAGN